MAAVIMWQPDLGQEQFLHLNPATQVSMWLLKLSSSQINTNTRVAAAIWDFDAVTQFSTRTFLMPKWSHTA